jgi:hypothetical protein
MSHLRTIGPDDQGHEVVLRVGDRLDVAPARRAGGWVVTEFPGGILRLEARPKAANSYSFATISVGDGRLSLAPAGPEARATGGFTVWIRVVRDMVQPPQA